MLKVWRALGGVFFVLCLAFTMAPISVADVPPGCHMERQVLPDGTFEWRLVCPGGGGGDPRPGTEPPPGEHKCYGRTLDSHGSTVEVPCTVDGGMWYPAQNCYIKPLSPQPPLLAGDPPGGTYWHCVSCPGAGGCFLPLPIWLPGSTYTPPPDPRVLAQMAVTNMRLRAIAAGIVPEARPGTVGVIGLPVWMWVADPGESTTGPVSRSVTLRGFTVIANARLDRIVWSMGDGTSVTCNGPGTPYQDSYGRQPSPTCGHIYTKQGTYTVTATSYWVIAWSGIGQTGSISRSYASSTQISEAEVQVINR